MTISESNRSEAEQEHFDQLVKDTGETWWGNTTPAGKIRMRRKAALLSRQTNLYDSAPSLLEIGCGTGTFTKYLFLKYCL